MIAPLGPTPEMVGKLRPTKFFCWLKNTQSVIKVTVLGKAGETERGREKREGDGVRGSRRGREKKCVGSVCSTSTCPAEGATGT